jgi:tartrate dehydratase alpha subunit/fumarate hydratase class I-like protein
LKLKHLELQLESGDRRCPLLELEVLLLDGVLEVYNHMGAGVHVLTGEV